MLPALRRCQRIVVTSAPSSPGARLVPGRSKVSTYVLVSVQDVRRMLTCIPHLIQVAGCQCPHQQKIFEL